MSAQPKSIFRKFRRSLFYLAAVFSVCVAGYLIYGWNLLDSVYMVVITMFGVGFGEVHPLDNAGKIFTMFVIIAGTSAVVFVIGEVIHLLVIALQRADGNILRSGFQEEKLQANDSVIIIGRVHSLPSALRGEVDRQEMV
jgi:voltage-gated potassium channel